MDALSHSWKWLTTGGAAKNLREGGEADSAFYAMEATLDAMEVADRILGMDVGNQFVGLAMTDGLGITVQPLFTLRRGKLKDDAKSIARLVRKHGIVEIVVGLPLHMSGEISHQATVATEFADAVRSAVEIPVVMFDERLTTQEAHQRLNEAEYGTRDRKKVLDQVAAVVLLESYLAERAYRAAREAR